MYGIDILPDNIAECHDRLFTEISSTYTQVHSRPLPLSLAKSLVFVMQKNILCGDATKYKTIHNESIIFYEWHFNNEQPTEVGYCTFNLYEIEDKSLFSQPQPLEKKHYLNLSSALKTETL